MREPLLALKDEPDDLAEVMAAARPMVAALDAAIVQSGLLQEAYAFDRTLVDALPDESAARKGEFFRDVNFTLN